MSTPPIHPSKLAPANATATPPNPSVAETLVQARPGQSYRLRVDFGAAYAALLGRKSGAASSIVEVVLRVTERTTAGGTREKPTGVVLEGSAVWRVSGCAESKVFRVPSELRCPFAPTKNFPVQIAIGKSDDRGGIADGSWIIGQFGTVVGAERVEVTA